MSFTYMSRTVADSRVIGTSGLGGIGIYRIRFSVQFSIPNWLNEHGEVVISNLRAEVHAGPIGGDFRILGSAAPEKPLFLEPGTHAREDTALFCLDLSESQLFALETQRNGGGLRFRLILSGRADGNRGRMEARDEITCEVTLSDWARILKEAAYRDILVFGIELPPTILGGQLTTARNLVAKAHQDLIAGQYDDVVSRCRKALDSVQATLGEKELTARVVERFQNARRSMTKLERELLVAEAVRNYCHPAHHVDDDGEPEWYSRSDATFLLALASAVVCSAVGRLEAQP